MSAIINLGVFHYEPMEVLAVVYEFCVRDWMNHSKPLTANHLIQNSRVKVKVDKSINQSPQ
ncbi:hypothetical protein CKAN_02061400 [Cinnamomum micranthum f. kanehirae]|uniref:Uncharacterized protein n=1 Tax=Cinnamomum micranthum f. kanehirae TaxID=337451 RepID=A0A443PL18_9MAGN|nr:hypothetical protein CKAN_02061400 [Cinnamomum micranthum f. kanehirae]